MGKLISASSLAGWQQALGQQLASYLGTQVGQFGTPYEGPLTAAWPDLSGAYSEYLANAGLDTGTIRDALLKKASGISGWISNPEDITKRWSETYASPAMEMWNERMAPLVAKQYNVPGGFQSGEMNRGIFRESEDFYKSLLPTLFAAQESETQRAFNAAMQAESEVLPATQLLGNLAWGQFGQQFGASQAMYTAANTPVAAEYADFLRRIQERQAAVSSALGVSMTPTMENIYKSSSGKTSGLGSLIGGIGGALFGKSLGFENPLQGGIFGTLLGGLF